MEKIASLRTALVAALPELARDPEKLVVFVDKGRLVSRLRGAGFGYEWRYTVRLEFRDFTRSPDTIAVPLLQWLSIHQRERLLEFAREDGALGFAADVIDPTTWDIAFAFELAEAVSASADADCAGLWRLTRIAEPVLDDDVPLGDAGAIPLLREIHDADGTRLL